MMLALILFAIVVMTALALIGAANQRQAVRVPLTISQALGPTPLVSLSLYFRSSAWRASHHCLCFNEGGLRPRFLISSNLPAGASLCYNIPYDIT